MNSSSSKQRKDSWVLPEDEAKHAYIAEHVHDFFTTLHLTSLPDDVKKQLTIYYGETLIRTFLEGRIEIVVPEEDATNEQQRAA